MNLVDAGSRFGNCYLFRVSTRVLAQTIPLQVRNARIFIHFRTTLRPAGSPHSQMESPAPSDDRAAMADRRLAIARPLVARAASRNTLGDRPKFSHRAPPA
jgi:hypothetical protein